MLGSDDVASEYILDLPSNVEAELRRMIPLGDAVAPLISIRNRRGTDSEAVVRGSPNVREAHLLESESEGELFAVEWSESVEDTLGVIDESGGILLNARGSNRGWELEIQFERRDNLRQLLDEYERSGVETTVNRISERATPEKTLPTGVTPLQRGTLRRAYRRGYFEIPRAVTLEELAEEEGVSSQAISERIRRALNTHLGGTLSRDE